MNTPFVLLLNDFQILNRCIFYDAVFKQHPQDLIPLKLADQRRPSFYRSIQREH